MFLSNYINFPRFVVFYLNFYGHFRLRQMRRKLIWPFDGEDVFGVLEDFGDFAEEFVVGVFEAVEVEVVEVLVGRECVFAVVGVGGAFDFDGVEAEGFGDLFDEGGFAGADFAVKVKHAAVFYSVFDLFKH